MKYQKTILANGLRVITVPMKDNPTVTVLVLVEAGSKYESKEKNGISHFLEHMCFKGTTRRPNNFDISTELDNIGSHYNAFTSQEYTGYYAKAEFSHLDKLLDILSDMYLNPILKDEEIEKEKGVIIEEINMYEDIPQHKVRRLFTSLVYGDQPAGFAIAGPKENIRQMNRNDFISYRQKFYTAEATTIVVAGNFNEGETIKKIEKIFSLMLKQKKGEKVKVREDQKEPKLSVFKKKTDQAHLILGVRTFDIYDKRNRIMDVLVGVLDAGMSSRLFKKLRDEMGICYYVNAGQDHLTDHGLFSVSAGVDRKRIREAVEAILKELSRLKTELVSPTELQKVKQNMIGSLSLSLELSDSIADFYGGQEIMNQPIKNPEQIKKEIESVTAQEIKDLAKEIFVNQGLNLAIVGELENEREIAQLLQF